MYETVSVQPTGGAWGQIGADIAPGIYPENLTCSVNDAGPDTASFTLKRNGAIPWNDLLPGSPVEIARLGLTGWSGRVETVGADNGDGTQTVQCKGKQHHLDDDMLRPFFLRRLLTAWKDWRSNLAASLTTFTTAMQVEAGEGGIVLTHPASAIAANGLAYYDAGPGCVVKRVVIDWAKVQGTTGGFYFSAGRTTAELSAGFINNAVNTATGSTSGTYTYTLSTPCRYVAIQFSEIAGNVADSTLRVSKALLFGEVAYESGGDSAFTLDVLAKYVLASGALPLLSTATDRIDAFAFGIPELDPQRRVTPRELINIGQAFHDARIQVDVDGKLVCQLRPTAPIVEVGSWSSHEFKDGSTTREPIVSGVFVEGTDAAGEPMETTVNSTAATLPSRQGYNKRNSLPLESTSTSAVQTQMGNLYTANHATAPFKGEQVVQGWGDMRAIDGSPRHAFHALLMSEELMRFGDRIDPDTGAQSRDGRIKSITYTANDEKASIGIDNESRKFEAIASRVAALNS